MFAYTVQYLPKYHHIPYTIVIAAYMHIIDIFAMRTTIKNNKLTRHITSTNSLCMIDKSYKTNNHSYQDTTVVLNPTNSTTSKQ